MEKEINKFHALQLFTDTFTAETVHLTNEAIGIYIRLLCFNWTKNTKPFTAEQAYRICFCRDDGCEKTVKAILDEFFIETDGKYTHKRLVKEHEYLISKYKRRSEAGKKGGLAKRDNATSKNVAPIPSPSPIPNNNIYDEFFLEHWKNLDIKRGSKFAAHKIWLKVSSEIPQNLDVADIYNRQVLKITDTQFVPHFSTWLSQRRWEIQEFDEKKSNSPTIIEKMIKLKFQHLGNEANYEIFQKDGKKYKIDRYDKDNLIQEA
nr:phage related protein [uncultured Mediterranean phage uvMED]